MKTTIKDVAELAGVSVSTVSRAINGSGRIDPRTCERILKLAKRINYRPSAYARGLVTRQSHSILLLLPDITNAYFAEMTKAIGRVCREHGYRVVLGTTDEDLSVEAMYLDLVHEQSVDAVIVFPMAGEDNLDQYREIERTHFPMVLIGSRLARLNCNFVSTDNVAGGHLAVDYLASKGHAKIAYVAPGFAHNAVRDRYEGYLSCHRDLGLDIREEYHIVFEQQPLEQGGRESAARLLSLSEPPTAIFAGNDMTAIGCIAAARALGKRIPEDIAVIGFDGIAIDSFLEVPLTTVAQPKEDIAHKTVELVLDLIGSKQRDEVKPQQEHILPPELVIRASA